MSKFPEFHLETNSVWGLITNEEELNVAFSKLKKDNCNLFKIFGKKDLEFPECATSFGTRREYDNHTYTLFQYLDENGVDITPWLQSAKTES